MNYRTFKIGKIATSTLELLDITKAWLAIALAFTIAFSGISLMGSRGLSGLFSVPFLILFIVSLFTVGIGFLFHEMAHKIVAQRYGCMAEFRAFDQMLVLAVALALVFGMTFVAPGAVMISGMITRKENGIISAAGPLTNYALGLIFLGLGYLLPAAGFIFSVGFQVNFWLGLFNMIPFLNFDGAKIINWNIAVWIGMVAVGVFFLFGV